MAAVVAEEGFDQAPVNEPPLLGIEEAQPAVVHLHTLHVLRVVDLEQTIDLFLGIVSKEFAQIGDGTTQDGPVALDEDVGSGQRA